MSVPDEIIHQTIRLRIMSALNALPQSELIEFTRLRSLVQATDGNLATHLATLENADYVMIKKDFVGKKPRTRIGMTRTGRRAFERHVSYLREILDLDGPPATA
jgi:DNA-binding MarR family transcriptional regulator